MNELPDLAAKIQVGLFNVLEERDIQIRGYPGPARPRPVPGLQRQPGGLHQPRPDRHAAQGPHRQRHPHALSADARRGHRHHRRQRLDRPRRRRACWCRRFMKEILEETARLARTQPGRQPAVGRQRPHVDRQLRERGLATPSAAACCWARTPVVPRISDLAYLAASTRGKIELTLTEDDGQEDKVIGKLRRRGGQERLRGALRAEAASAPLVEWFEGGKTLRDRRPRAVDGLRPQAERRAGLEEGSGAVPQEDGAGRSPAASADALAASAVEFLLEGLHVENRLNKSAKGSEIVFKR